MSNGSDEIEIFRQAAKAAASLLPQLEQQRTELDKRIAHLRSMLLTWEDWSGETSNTPSTPPTLSSHRYPPTRSARGEVTTHIDAVLGTGESYEEPELRGIIEQRFSRPYARSSVSAALARGEREGKYERDGRRWRMKSVETAQHSEESDDKEERRESDGQIANAPSFFAGVAEKQ